MEQPYTIICIYYMFKSSVHGTSNKKGPLSFIKSPASPKHADRSSQLHTAKSISTLENETLNDILGKQTAIGSLSIELTLQKCYRPLKLTFHYGEETTVEELIAFLKRETKESFIYFKSKNINLEYYLTLPLKRVNDLNTKRLQLTCLKMKMDSKHNLLNNFEIIKCLGTGGFSKVYLVRGFGMLMAMKVINKNFILQNEKENIVESERTILQKCNGHPFITKLYMSFETENCLIFCMEYCHGGELFNLLRKVKRMKQTQAKFYFLETLTAIAHLHSQKMLYRDLKPENIIIDSEGHLRLADYGLSKVMIEDMTYSFCGSAEYMAPQMLLKKGHGFQIDYYCLGALLYELLFGLPPYYSRNQNELFDNILNNQLQFPPFADISDDLEALLRKLLEKDAQLRFKSAEQILKSPWLSDCKVDQVLAKKMKPPFPTQMFQNNFDDSDFIQEEKVEIMMLQKEKNKGKLPQKLAYFQDFFYIDQQLVKAQIQAHKNQQKKLDFTKKQIPVNIQHALSPNKELLWRNGSIKSIDNSQIFAQNTNNYSPRVMQTLNRSNDKFRMVTSQSSQIQSNPPFLSTVKTSQVNLIKGSQNFNCSGSKISNFRRVPQISKSQQQPGCNERFGSPININNYINIYTCKSPTHQNSSNFTSNNFGSPQPKKTFSYGNVSYEKSINSSYKSTSNIYNSISTCDRVKFCSSDKPTMSIMPLTSNMHKNISASQSATQVNRGYLSNFKERFNPNQKIKKSYKNPDKANFNFFSAATPYKQS